MHFVSTPPKEMFQSFVVNISEKTQKSLCYGFIRIAIIKDEHFCCCLCRRCQGPFGNATLIAYIKSYLLLCKLRLLNPKRIFKAFGKQVDEKAISLSYGWLKSVSKSRDTIMLQRGQTKSPCTKNEAPIFS